MYFGDSDTLEKSLHNDMNTLIRNIKIRQDQHLKLLDYNRAVAIKQRDLEDTIFINDQLTKHRNFFDKIKEDHQTMTLQEKEILGKYEFISANIYNEAIFKLMSRVGARIMEMVQSSQQKTKTYQELEDRHKKVKGSLVKTLNQKEKIDIQQLLSIVIAYIHDKVEEEVVKLAKMIQLLQTGDADKLNFIYERRNEKKNNLSANKKQMADHSLDLKKEKQKIKERIVQLKQEAKHNQSIKKQKNKLAHKMVTALYSTMDISKNQFMEDMVCINPNEKYKKLYNQIYSRNKLNKQQIMAFEAKTQLFHQKVSKFKEMMLAESAKIQQAVIIKSSPKRIIDEQPKQKTQQEVQVQPERLFASQRQIPTTDIILPQVQMFSCKFTQQRPFRTSIQKAQSPRLVKESAQFYSMQSTQQASHHLKFDSKQQNIYLRSNRAKLPQIARVSADQNMFLSSKKNRPKQDQKINIASNVNIDGQFTHKTGKVESFSLKKDKPNLDYIRDGSKQQDSVAKSFEYTFYIKKRTNRFYETRNHFIV